MPSCSFMFAWSSAVVHVLGIALPGGPLDGSMDGGGVGPCRAPTRPASGAAATAAVSRSVRTRYSARMVPRILPVFAATVAAAAIAAQDPAPARTWGYGGGPRQIRFSPLTQISRDNVARLEVAWTYDTGEPGALQTQPVVVEDVLYGYTTTHKT